MIIQVVDDEFDIANVIQLYLQQIGFNAVGFTDSSMAFEHFKINCTNCMLSIAAHILPLPPLVDHHYLLKLKVLFANKIETLHILAFFLPCDRRLDSVCLYIQVRWVQKILKVIAI
jgi:hypothetical protein